MRVSTEDRSASDAGLNSPSDLDGGSPTASSSVPSPADYPDTPDTTTCIPQYQEDEGVSAGLTPLFFIWQSAFGAQEYKFELAKDSAFNELIFVNQLLSEPLTERYFQLPDTYELTPSTTYFWRVHSVSNNVSALCTRHFSFQTP